MAMGVPTTDNNLQPNTQTPPEVTSKPLEFIVPTEIVTLPSKGQFYPEGHPLHGRETVEIKHMTTKEEDILTNQSFIKNGVAVDKLLQSVLVEPKMKVNDMLMCDKNALTVACRVYGYGPDYTTQFKCPACDETLKHEFDLNEVGHVDYETNVKEFDAAVDYDRGIIVFPIPRTKTTLELKVLKTDMTPKNRKEAKKAAFSITKQYRKMIHSVNGSTERAHIDKYIESMSALDSRYLRSAYPKIVPNVDFGCEFECESCGHEDTVEVPLSAEFFWPKS